MAAIPAKPTYFLAPNCDFLPTSPSLALGSIITDPARPEKTLNKSNRVAIPAGDIQAPFKDDWQDTIRKLRHHKLTIWASFLQLIFGIGVDLNGSYKNESEDVYEFKKLETKYFTPDEEYINTSLAANSVKSYMKATRWKKPVYMVTGVKIAIGAHVTSKRVKGWNAGGKLGFDGASLAVPVSAGPTAENSVEGSQNVEFGNSSDYVFAYRVTKITMREDGSMVDTEYTKGAMFGVEKGSNEEESHKWVAEELNVGEGVDSGFQVTDNVYDDDDDDEMCFVVKI